MFAGLPQCLPQESIVLWNSQNSYCCHCTDATIEAQREQLSSLRSPSEIVMLIELEPSPGLSLVHAPHCPFPHVIYRLCNHSAQTFCSTAGSKVAPGQAGLRLPLISLQ